MPLTDFPQFLHDVTRRYRASLIARTGLTAALSLGVCGALAWRLHRLHRSMIWSAGLPVTLALLAIGLLVWRLRRRWLFAATAIAQLDRALGLQQRLITAEEFARAQEKPALYPLLLEDLARRASEARVRFPRPLDRSAGTLLVALMVLLLWPHLHEASRGVLTQRPSTSGSQDPHHEEPPPVPDSEEERQPGGSSSDRDSADQSTASGAGAPQSSTSTGASQDGSSGASSDGQTGQDGRSKNPSPQTDSQGRGGTGQQPQAADHGSDRQESRRARAQPGAESASHAADARAQAAEEGARSEPRAQPSPSSQAGAGDPQQASRRTAQSAHQKGAAHQQAARATSASDAASSAPPEAGQSSSQASQGRAAAPGAGGQGQSGGEDALKAEIQQLLKEVSGELQRLETQLAATSNDANPTAGTSTDPNLYESAMPLDGAPQGSLPIQLRTDQAPTRAQRPGSGVGAPSGEAARASPQTAPTEAQLAEAPLEEPPVARQTVPREYQSVFDRLHRREQ